MSPKSNWDTKSSSTKHLSDETTKSDGKKLISCKKVIKREEIFMRMDNPFYLQQHVFHMIWLGLPHVFTVYYCYLHLTGQVPSSTLLFEIGYAYFGGFGTTVGCHRYWTHKTFKAKMPLQILLMIMQTVACQHPIHKWCMDHRIHHKYTDTNADPHNSKRGFWFSHMGWLFLPKHPEFQEKLKTFDMSDLEADPVVRFQSRWYLILTTIFHSILPIWVFCYVWNLPVLYAYAANSRRYIILLHATWTVNSFAHIWGSKPYDKNISAVENQAIAFLAGGEGWHNFHHSFPWDYKASEFGWKINPSTMIIDFFAWIGWAYDLKTVSPKLLRDRMIRTGDKTAQISNSGVKEEFKDDDFDYTLLSDADNLLMGRFSEEGLWGWDDDKLPENFRQVTNILFPEKNKEESMN